MGNPMTQSTQQSAGTAGTETLLLRAERRPGAVRRRSTGVRGGARRERSGNAHMVMYDLRAAAPGWLLQDAVGRLTYLRGAQ